MPGGAAVEHAAEGIIAKAAKSVLRDAVSAGAKDAARDTAADTARVAAGDVARDAGGDAARSTANDAARSTAHDVDLDSLPSWVEGAERDPVGARNIPDDYKPYGDKTRQEFYNEHWNDEEGHWNYPDDDGFSGSPTPNSLEPGDTIDRYGRPSGNYTSPADTPFDQRALPPTNLSAPYYRYEVVKPLPPSVTEGKVASAFEQPGGGIQHFFDRSIEDYVPEFLRQVYP